MMAAPSDLEVTDQLHQQGFLLADFTALTLGAAFFPRQQSASNGSGFSLQNSVLQLLLFALNL